MQNTREWVRTAHTSSHPLILLYIYTCEELLTERFSAIVVSKECACLWSSLKSLIQHLQCSHCKWCSKSVCLLLNTKYYFFIWKYNHNRITRVWMWNFAIITPTNTTHTLKTLKEADLGMPILGMFISDILSNRQPMLVNRLLTVNRQDYFKLELN